MSEVEFNFEGNINRIQCNKDEKMEDICLKFATKIGIDIDQLYFLYSSRPLNLELSFDECLNNEDKERNKMNILANRIFNENNENKITSFFKSKEIICPKCGENAKIKIENYKITLFGCKNNHETNNIFLNEFENTQNVDLSKIVCDKCKENNKSNTFENKFLRCINCNINLCPLCQSNHDKNHNIINYDIRNYKCKIHNDSYTSYCKTCKENICTVCEINHNAHEIIHFGQILPNIDDLKNKKNEVRNIINKFNENINKIIRILNNVKDNIEKYYKLYDDIINNFDYKNRNYEMICNIIEINKNELIIDLENIINEKSIRKNFKNIINIYSQMISKDVNGKLNIIYKINENDKKIRIFGDKFVKNNKNKCKISFEGNEYELQECFDITNNKSNKLEISLIGIKDITDLSYMFYSCSSLLSLPDKSDLDFKQVTNMYHLFANCSSLISLPVISKWNTSLVENMALMFYNCSSLKSLPDISEWNTKNVKFMYQMFEGCSSLSSLPDISKWDTSNVTNLSWMFAGCSSLVSLPEISKWNITNVKEKDDMFEECNKSLKIPSIFS